jgi:uncharacterized protein
MTDLSAVQTCLLMLVFAWSGFVRAGLGFGGTALALPLALIVVESAQVVVPLFLVQLFVLSGVHTWRHRGNIDWRSVGYLTALLVMPVLAGVYTLIKLPHHGFMTLVYLCVLGVAMQYIVPFEFTSTRKAVDLVLLLVGGYVLGSTTAGGPPIVAVSMRYVARDKVRDTLLGLWLLVSAMNLVVLSQADVDLQWRSQLWLLPATVVGHCMGDRCHRQLLTMQTTGFYRVVGAALLIVTVIGLIKLWW